MTRTASPSTIRRSATAQTAPAVAGHITTAMIGFRRRADAIRMFDTAAKVHTLATTRTAKATDRSTPWRRARISQVRSFSVASSVPVRISCQSRNITRAPAMLTIDKVARPAVTTKPTTRTPGIWRMRPRSRSATWFGPSSVNIAPNRRVVILWASEYRLLNARATSASTAAAARQPRRTTTTAGTIATTATTQVGARASESSPNAPPARSANTMAPPTAARITGTQSHSARLTPCPPIRRTTDERYVIGEYISGKSARIEMTARIRGSDDSVPLIGELSSRERYEMTPEATTMKATGTIHVLTA